MEDSNLDKLARAEAECIASHFGLMKVTETVPSDATDQIYRVRTSRAAGYAGQTGAYKNMEGANTRHN